MPGPFTRCVVCGIVISSDVPIGRCSRHGGGGGVPMFEEIDETDDVGRGTFPTNRGSDDDVLRARLRASGSYRTSS